MGMIKHMWEDNLGFLLNQVHLLMSRRTGLYLKKDLEKESALNRYKILGNIFIFIAVTLPRNLPRPSFQHRFKIGGVL